MNVIIDHNNTISFVYNSVRTLKINIKINNGLKILCLLLLHVFTDTSPACHILWKSRDRLSKIILDLIYEALPYLGKEIIVSDTGKKILHLLIITILYNNNVPFFTHAHTHTHTHTRVSISLIVALCGITDSKLFFIRIIGQ